MAVPTSEAPMTPAPFLRGFGAESACTVSDLIRCVGVPAHEITPKIMGAFTLLMAEIRRLRLEKAQSESRIEELRGTAPAPMSNREAFDKLAETLLAAARRDGHEATLLHVVVEDIDGINGRFGFDVGDQVLVQVAGILKAETRASDLVGRIAGAHFAVLLADGTTADARVLSHRLDHALAQQPFDGPTGPLSIRLRHTIHPATGAVAPVNRLISAA
ncbi:MAG: GGDEF domain-containing protein [Azospirillaceae bacterium]|nr:GGDEF domain-containing protein [Azospirillaceae bacterium]